MFIGHYIHSTCLAVREKADVVAVQRALHKVRDFLKHVALGGRCPEHAVERERLLATCATKKVEEVKHLGPQ
jgi:hypothetical protein